MLKQDQPQQNQSQSNKKTNQWVMRQEKKVEVNGWQNTRRVEHRRPTQNRD